MSDRVQRRGPVKNTRIEAGDHITDPVELERLAAQRPPDDGGAARVQGAALSILIERESVGKAASAVPMILALVELLTPEQQLDLARRLPPQLGDEARTLLTDSCRDIPTECSGAK